LSVRARVDSASIRIGTIHRGVDATNGRVAAGDGASVGGDAAGVVEGTSGGCATGDGALVSGGAEVGTGGASTSGVVTSVSAATWIIFRAILWYKHTAGGISYVLDIGVATVWGCSANNRINLTSSGVVARSCVAVVDRRTGDGYKIVALYTIGCAILSETLVTSRASTLLLAI